MPCYDTSYGEDYSLELKKRSKRLKKRLDLTTRLLCSLCKALEKSKQKEIIDTVSSGDLGTWWKNHKKIDARKKRKGKNR